MEPKTQVELLSLFERASHNAMPPTMQQEWTQAYDDFCFYLEQTTFCLKFIPAMRCMEHLRIDLTDLFSRLECKNGTEDCALCFCKKALEAVRSEIHMLDLRLQYPALAENKRQFPPLYLSSDFTLTDLVELIVALNDLKVFCLQDGRKAPLIALVRIFEMAFNVSLPNFEVIRTAALNRKIHLTKFLDKLRSAFIDLSQR